MSGDHPAVRAGQWLAVLALLGGPAVARAQTPYPPVTSAEVRQSLGENRAVWQAKIDALGRPRLLYDKAELAAVRERLMGGARSPEVSALLAKAYAVAPSQPVPYVSPEEKHAKTGESIFSANGEEWARNVGDQITLLAVALALDPSPTLRKALHDGVIAGCNFPTWGRGNSGSAGDNMDLACAHMARATALAWDWFPDLWTPAERELILKTISARVSQLLVGLYGKGFWCRGYEDNHNHIDCMAMGWCGVAFFNDLPQAPEWLAAARLDYQNVARFCPADGSSAEGVPYWSYGMNFILQYVEGTRRVVDSTVMYQSPYLKNSSSFRLNVSTSGLNGTLPWGDAPPKDFDGPQHILSRFATEYKDASAAWLSHHIPWKPDGSEDVLAWTALWQCEPANQPNLPLDYHLSAADIVTTRSGWGPGDYVLAIKSGFTNRNHSHLDAGALAFAFNAEWLLTTPGYGLGKTSPDYWDNGGKRWTFYANATESHCALLINGKNQLFDRQSRGTVDHFLSTPQQGFAGIDLTGAYADADSVRREVLHRRGDYLLVFDTVRAKQPATVECLTQFPAEPEKAGNALVMRGETGQLHVETLVPAGPLTPRKPTSTHVDVRPENIHTYAARGEGAEVKFVSLLQPGFSRDELPPLQARVAPTTPGDAMHVVVQGGGWTDDVIHAPGTAPTQSELPGAGGVPAVKATATLLSVRSGGAGVQSCLAVGASALTLPGVEIKPPSAVDIGLQKTPEGAWVLDASQDIRAQTTLEAGLTIQPLEPASSNAFRYLVAKNGVNAKAASDWLASLIVFREKSPVRVRALTPQPPLPSSVVIPVAAANFSGQQRGSAEAVEGKPGATGPKTLRGFGNAAPEHVVNWQFDVARAGQYQLTIRYATELTDVTTGLLIDGVAPSPATVKFALPATGGWSIKTDNWRKLVLTDAPGKPLVLPLAAGRHELRLVNPSGALALDQFEFRGTGQ